MRTRTIIMAAIAVAGFTACTVAKAATVGEPPTTTTTVAPTTVAPTTTSTSTTTSTTTTVPAPHLDRFAGSWYHHGIGVDIAADGSGTMIWRTYQWCNEDPTPPCDGIEGNMIIDGGHGKLQIVSVHGDSAEAFVSTSTQTSFVPDGLRAIRLLPDHKLTFIDTIFCSDATKNFINCGA